MRTLVLAAAAFLLVACQSGPNAAQQAWNYCSSNGTEKNLDKINICLSNFDREREARIAQSNATSRAMMAASLTLLSQNNRPVVAPPIVQRRTYCTTRYNAFLRQYQTICS